MVGTSASVAMPLAWEKGQVVGQPLQSAGVVGEGEGEGEVVGVECTWEAGVGQGPWDSSLEGSIYVVCKSVCISSSTVIDMLLQLQTWVVLQLGACCIAADRVDSPGPAGMPSEAFEDTLVGLPLGVVENKKGA